MVGGAAVADRCWTARAGSRRPRRGNRRLRRHGLHLPGLPRSARRAGGPSDDQAPADDPPGESAAGQDHRGRLGRVEARDGPMAARLHRRAVPRPRRRSGPQGQSRATPSRGRRPPSGPRPRTVARPPGSRPTPGRAARPRRSVAEPSAAAIVTGARVETSSSSARITVTAPSRTRHGEGAVVDPANLELGAGLADRPPGGPHLDAGSPAPPSPGRRRRSRARRRGRTRRCTRVPWSRRSEWRRAEAERDPGGGTGTQPGAGRHGAAHFVAPEEDRLLRGRHRPRRCRPRPPGWRPARRARAPGARRRRPASRRGPVRRQRANRPPASRRRRDWTAARHGGRTAPERGRRRPQGAPGPRSARRSSRSTSSSASADLGPPVGPPGAWVASSFIRSNLRGALRSRRGRPAAPG